MQTHSVQNQNSPRGSSETHSKLINEVLLAVSKSQHARVWRNETGMALNIRTQKPFRYGLVGSADILGVLSNGKFVALECKTGGAKQSDQQVKFANMVHRMKGYYFVVRSVDEALQRVQEATRVERGAV